ncbi:hypothetical protein CSUNSWCD_1733 [Campylobacter showae CSUNSWCD]|uniref:Uncharacterized protein n=1 Tax=Campylobacter showae CSUNSWCD TaxID=1244083 RepID=M5IKV3_9BACT|nr:hypothetical protein CSUNSWCD_1733 [Campylobacter showae CSUNSWCD]
MFRFGGGVKFAAESFQNLTQIYIAKSARPTLKFTASNLI